MPSSKLSPLFPTPCSFIVFVVAIVVAILLNPVNPAPTPDDSLNSYYYNYNPDTYGGMTDTLTDWTNNQEWAPMSGRIQKPKCISPLPSNLTLCRGIGYESMMLPNLLGHDSLTEVTSQATAWVPLVNVNCHPDSKIFFCSLFAPVCLERLIQPCRGLCQGVQAACEPRMQTYGFNWPDMLKCDKFPEDNDMCIRLIHNIKPEADKNCSACKHPLTHESLIDHFCRADIAIRVTVKEFKDRKGHKELILRKKKKIFKLDGVTKKEVRNLTPVIEGGASCTCDTINATQERYLLMGNKQGNQLVINFGMLYNRKDREFKKGLKAIRKGNTCEGIFKEISANGNGGDTKRSGGEKGERRKKRRKEKKDNGKKERDRKRGRRGKKDKGDRRRKGRKGKGRKGKGRKGRKNRDRKGEASPNTASRRGSMSKSELEDRALSNFMKASN